MDIDGWMDGKKQNKCVCIYTCIYVYVYICMYVCIHMYMYVCMYAGISISVAVKVGGQHSHPNLV